MSWQNASTSGSMVLPTDMGHAAGGQSGSVIPEEDQMHEFSPPEIIFWAFYRVCDCPPIAFLAVSGNALVVYVVLARRKMQNVPNFFIVNLALADAITGLIAVPFKFQAALLQMWTLPAFMCQLLTFTETLSLGVSVFTLTASAVDRFTVVMVPQASKMTKPTAVFVIVAIWVFSIACSLPFGAFHKTVAFVNEKPQLNALPSEVPAHAIWRCLPVHANEPWWTWYNIYLTIIQYFVPLIIVDGAYVIIAYRVWLAKPHEHKQEGERKKSRSASVLQQNNLHIQGASVVHRTFHKDRRKVVKLLVIVVALFTFCWLPYETYLLLSEIRPRINVFYYINVIFMTAHCLAMSNSCINPIIYGIYNKKFQREYRRVFYRCCGLGEAARTALQSHRLMSTTSRMQPNMEMADSAANFITNELGK